MDDLHRRTINRGLLIAAAIFAVGFAITLFDDSPTAQWISFFVTMVSLLFFGVWFFMTWRGFRIKAKSKLEMRAKEKQRREREKLAKLRR